MTKYLLLRSFAVVAWSTTLCCGAWASGFYLPQQSVQGVGRAQAGNAAVGEPGSIFFNPAGMVLLDGNQVALNAHGILPDARLDDSGSTLSTLGTAGTAVPASGSDGSNITGNKLLPNFYGAWHINRNSADTPAAWIGFGVTVPVGLGSEYRRDSFVRYGSVKSELIAVNIGPVFAVGNRRWSVGLGLDIQLADAELSNALPDPLQPGGPTPETDGFFQLDGDDTSYGFNVGALYAFGAEAATRVGVHYRSSVKHDFEGSVTTSGLSGPLAPNNGTLSGTSAIELPDILSLALSHRTGAWTWLGQVSWFGWDAFDEIRIVLPGGLPDLVRPTRFEDAVSIAAGMEFEASQNLTLRAGLAYEESIVSDEFRATTLPDADHYWISAGLSWQTQCEALGVDLGLAHLIYDDVGVRQTTPFYTGTPVAGEGVIRAGVDTGSNTVSLGLRWRFGNDRC